ncbi:MAG: hypothetical protein K0S08_2152 [Gammaproteobacteria bacterium]|jgi:hypothetical protein|nr:hypothetical protein [Gammaproteobacteria bacterium]
MKNATTREFMAIYSKIRAGMSNIFKQDWCNRRQTVFDWRCILVKLSPEQYNKMFMTIRVKLPKMLAQNYEWTDIISILSDEQRI